MKEHERVVIQKIKAYAIQATQFKGDMTYEEFAQDAKTIAACTLNLSQIGELAGRLDDGFMETHAHIPWRKIKGMRNRIVHDYDGLRMNIVWDVLTGFLPELITKLDLFD